MSKSKSKNKKEPSAELAASAKIEPGQDQTADLDKEVKFDRELDWCIQKLNTRLLNEKDLKKG